VRKGGAHHTLLSSEHDGERTVPNLFIFVTTIERREARNASVVDQYVNRAKIVGDPLDHLCNSRFVADIQCIGAGIGPAFKGNRFAGSLVDICYGDLCSLRSEQFGGGTPHAAGCAGYDGNASFD